VTVRDVDMRDLHLPLLLEGGRYRIGPGPTSLPLLGGTVEIGRIEAAPGARRALEVAFVARELDLQEIGRILGVRPIPGRVQLRVDSLALDGDVLRIDGVLSFYVFGGSLELRGISVEHPFEPYRSIGLDLGTVRGFDLAEIGRTFGFGIASGTLEGRVEGLRVVGSRLAAFEAQVESVPRPGVSQFIDKRAIESIQRILSGPFGAIESAFFNRFRYAGFGFTCSLDRGEFRFRGKYRLGGTEYVMYSAWYQFPKVSIINARPGIVYDWDTILRNLEAISGPKEEGSKP